MFLFPWVTEGFPYTTCSISAYLANAGRKVTVVFETADAFLAYKKPLPDFIRKSRFVYVMPLRLVLASAQDRFLAILSPHMELRTRLE